MKKIIKMTLMSASLSLSLLLTGCGNTTVPAHTEKNADYASFSDEAVNSQTTAASSRTAELQNTSNPDSSSEDNTISEQTTLCSLPPKPETTTVVQGGPYGKLSLCLPDGWSYEAYPMDSEKLQNGLYGIRFYPEGVEKGGIELAYIDSFGVCGTGLYEETATVAGNLANIGTYDNHAYWDFISFREDYSGIVALTYNVESWWDEYSEQVMDILDTLSYDVSEKEGGAYIRTLEAELDKIGLNFTLEKITPTGATLVFHQYDEKAPTGELEYEDAFELEILKNNQWEKVPDVVNGEYGFHQIAYTIPKRASTECALNWEWLYGTLKAGSYRIKKTIIDFRASGDFDNYTVCAQFILN